MPPGPAPIIITSYSIFISSQNKNGPASRPRSLWSNHCRLLAEYPTLLWLISPFLWAHIGRHFLIDRHKCLYGVPKAACRPRPSVIVFYLFPPLRRRRFCIAGRQFSNAGKICRAPKGQECTANIPRQAQESGALFQPPWLSAAAREILDEVGKPPAQAVLILDRLDRKLFEMVQAFVYIYP